MAPRVLGPASRRTGRVANRRPWLLPPRPAHAGIFQLASAAEIVHAALGLVGGSPATAAMQWAGRSNVLFGVVAAVPQVQASAAVGAMLLAWALSEVVRYPWYAATTAGICPPWLTWLRRAAGTVFWRGGPAAAAKRFLPLPLPACLHPPPPSSLQVHSLHPPLPSGRGGRDVSRVRSAARHPRARPAHRAPAQPRKLCVRLCNLPLGEPGTSQGQGRGSSTSSSSSAA